MIIESNMDFVTKEQFESAIALLQKALANGQIVDGSSKIELKKILFTNDDDNFMGLLCKSGQVAFVAPVQAARNKIHLVRSTLRAQTENATKTRDVVAKLEQELQRLSSLIQTIKE